MSLSFATSVLYCNICGNPNGKWKNNNDNEQAQFPKRNHALLYGIGTSRR